MLPSVSFMVIACWVVVVASGETHDLNVLNMMSMTGSWRGGMTMKVASEMAVDHINNRSQLLPGYRLRLINKDTQVSENEY